MTAYIVRRILLLFPSLLIVFTITFLLMHATPGGPWDRNERPLPQNVIDTLNAKYGLDKPIWEQYGIFLSDVLHGDLGQSYSHYGQDVSTIIVSFFPVSFQLGSAAMGVALVLGISLGLVSGVNHNSSRDYLASFFSVVGISTPNYVVATVLIIIFAIYLGWLPTGGWDGIFSVKIIIPVIALALAPMALIARYTRSSVLDVFHRDYVRTARAKGLKEQSILIRHVLRNALVPVVTVAGIAFAEIVTGSFFVESVTAVPGIGRYFVTSVSGRDYPVIIGTTLLFAAIVMIMNLVVDIAYVYLDPRVRYN
ncbi:MAG TPA: ABC transporter permease [Anaerolineae bacterium]|nr:ABC transporter permease [Anaerolineae bacterium]